MVSQYLKHMESLQLTDSELSIPLLLVDTDFLSLICLFSKLILFFSLSAAIFFLFPQLPCRCYADTECGTELFFPGDTLIGYFSGVQTTPKSLWFSGRLWMGEFQLFLCGQSTDTHVTETVLSQGSRVTATRMGQQGWKVTPGKAWSQSRELNECISYQALLIILWAVAVKAALSNHTAAQYRQVGFVLLCY